MVSAAVVCPCFAAAASYLPRRLRRHPLVLFLLVHQDRVLTRLVLGLLLRLRLLNHLLLHLGLRGAVGNLPLLLRLLLRQPPLLRGHPLIVLFPLDLW